MYHASDRSNDRAISKRRVVISGPFIFPAQSISDSNLQVGIDFGGGASLPVSQVLDLRAEAWYSVVSGDFSQVSLKFGMLYKM